MREGKQRVEIIFSLQTHLNDGPLIDCCLHIMFVILSFLYAEHMFLSSGKLSECVIVNFKVDGGWKKNQRNQESKLHIKSAPSITPIPTGKLQKKKLD